MIRTFLTVVTPQKAGDLVLELLLECQPRQTTRSSAMCGYSVVSNYSTVIYKPRVTEITRREVVEKVCRRLSSAV